VPAAPLRVEPSAASLAAGLERIRGELEIPGAFPDEVEEEAREAARRGPPPDPGRRDRTGLSLVTIDPPGSRDLDQALLIERRGDGHRVRYAIADVAALVRPGGAVDREARERGVTLYLPDRRTPLHPDVLGEGAASLLPGQDRPALLWTIDLDASGEAEAVEIERATVRSRAALAYGQVQERIDAGTAEEPLALLREVGERRLAQEAARGGVSLSVPAQAIEPAGSGYRLRYEIPLPVERWNAQVSLLTGICAARIMLEGGVGLFRVLAPADEAAVAGLRRSAAALGVPWGPDRPYPEVVRALDPADPGHAAFAVRASRLFRGAGYEAWARAAGEPPPPHAAIAAPYAHVTAPLRRMADRVANEVVLALSRGQEPPAWALEALPDMPDVMRRAGAREHAAERLALDYLESVLLAGRVGEVFEATVVDMRDDRPVVQIAEPAVIAKLDAQGPRPGERLRVRLTAADPDARRVVFSVAETIDS
jgi:exoribonuclease R